MKIYGSANAATVKLLAVLMLLSIGLGGCGKRAPLKLAAPIQAELDKAVAGLACMPAETFPYASQEHNNAMCNQCDGLVQAGLLTRDADSPDPDPASTFYQAARANVRYDLTDIGRSAYVPSPDGRTTYGAAQFCFGTAHVVQIKRLFGPVMVGSMQKALGIRFIAQLDNPNPFVYDPRIKQLNVRVPSAAMPGKPLIYPEIDWSAVINANNPSDVYLDSNLHVGPIGGS